MSNERFMSNKNNFISDEQTSYLNYLAGARKGLADGNSKSAQSYALLAIASLLRIGACVDESIRSSFIFAAIELVRDHFYTNKPDEKSIVSALNEISVPREYIANEISRSFLNEVAGLEDVKREVLRKAVYPIAYPDLFKRYGKSSRGGILLYGLPGTGKTMIARAIAKGVNAEFISIKCSDLLSKWFGETVNNIKNCFEKARESERAVIFFDEFDAIGGRRGEDVGAVDRAVCELLAQMQGVEEKENENVLIIAATNRPWNIDSAFLRGGRFGSKIYVPLPDRAARKQILEHALLNVPANVADIDGVAAKTEGYSGADVHEVCEMAKIIAIEREISTGAASELCQSDFEQALTMVKSSISNVDVVAMNNYRDQE